MRMTVMVTHGPSFLPPRPTRALPVQTSCDRYQGLCFTYQSGFHSWGDWL